ncbi:MAG: HEAT repeat domain-containing protein [Planctomycetes bacterium]|nr:HEAT repeat domain-containing protein [Planctomycetota bacterium]MCB9905249.1 HEAT repeat domain-containing protein [Planctomycetota bacterium]
MKTLIQRVAFVVCCCAPLATAQTDGSAPNFDDPEEETPVVENLTSWQRWWDWNEAYYLRLADHVRELPTSSGDQDHYLGTGQTPVPRKELTPDLAQLQAEVVPALVEIALGSEPIQLRSASLIALGRIGSAAAGEIAEGRDLVAFLGSQLEQRQTRVAESAVLALGLCADPNALQPLAHVLLDDEQGRTLTRRSSVPYRMRAVAAYALGLGAERAPIAEAKRYAALHLAEGLQQKGASRDQQVACVLALGLCTIEAGGQDLEAASELPPSASREALVAFLLDSFESERTEILARAHAATSLAKLARDLDDEWRELVVDSLRRALARGGGGRNEVRQSAALALGMLADCDADGLDKRVRDTLVKSSGQGDQQVQFFSLIALAQVGSRPGSGPDPFAARDAVEAQLSGYVQRGSSRGKPWAGLALGVYARGLLEHGEAPSVDLIELLAKETEKTKSPDDVGGYGIGLGLARGSEHREMLEERMWDYRRRDRARGDLLVAIGLMGESRSAEKLEETMQFHKSRPIATESSGLNLLFRPLVLERTSVALALLGHKSVVFTLIEQLGVAGSQESRIGVLRALAQVGDARAVGPLLALLRAKERTSLTRAEAAAALGQVSDPFDMPWQASYTVGTNYRAATETFGDVDVFGLLELR